MNAQQVLHRIRALLEFGREHKWFRPQLESIDSTAQSTQRELDSSEEEPSLEQLVREYLELNHDHDEATDENVALIHLFLESTQFVYSQEEIGRDRVGYFENHLMQETRASFCPECLQFSCVEHSEVDFNQYCVDQAVKNHNFKYDPPDIETSSLPEHIQVWK